MLCLFDTNPNISRVLTNSAGEVITGATVAELLASFQEWEGRPLYTTNDPNTVYEVAAVPGTAGEETTTYLYEIRGHYPVKQTARNNSVLARIRRQVNASVFRHAADVLNRSGEAAAVRYVVSVVYREEAHEAYTVYFTTGAAPATIIEAVRVLHPSAPFADTEGPLTELLTVNAEDAGLNVFQQNISVWDKGYKLLTMPSINCVGWKASDGLDALKTHLQIYAEAAFKQYPDAWMITAYRSDKTFAEWERATTYTPAK